MKRTKNIFSPLTAKYLLRRGFYIIDLKTNKETGKDVYVFELTDGLGDILSTYTKEHTPETTNYLNTYLVFEREIAKRLLEEGNRIVDLKANRYDSNSEVYVFLNE